MIAVRATSDVQPLTPGAAHTIVVGHHLAFKRICLLYPVNDEMSESEIDQTARQTGSSDYLHALWYLTLIEHTANRVHVIATYMRDKGIGTTGQNGRRQRVALSSLLRAFNDAAAALTVYSQRYPDKLSHLTGRIFETDWLELERQILDDLPGRDLNEGDELT